MQYVALVVFIIEVLLSHAPGEASGNQSKWLSSMTGVKEGLLRRLAHVILFAASAVTAGFGFGVWGIGAVAVWAVVDEISKIPVPGRHASAFDIFLNACGCIGGCVLYFLLRSA